MDSSRKRLNNASRRIKDFFAKVVSCSFGIMLSFCRGCLACEVCRVCRDLCGVLLSSVCLWCLDMFIPCFLGLFLGCICGAFKVLRVKFYMFKILYKVYGL